MFNRRASSCHQGRSRLRMPRIKSARSEISEVDGLSEREIELAKLQNRYRLMQVGRQSLSEESRGEIRRQQALLDSLEKEREDLLKEMRLVESRSNQAKDEVNCNTLVTLADTQESLLQSIEEEKAKHVEIDSKIREWERKIRKQMVKNGGLAGVPERKFQMAKRLRTLENRLDNTAKKYNKILTHNSELRNEIDGFRIERKRFDNLYKKLDKAIARHQNEIADLIESSTQAYEQREEARAKILQLQSKADKDLAQHNAEMKELIRIIDHDRCLRQFMTMKMSERHEDEQLTTWKARKSKEAEDRRRAAEDSMGTFETAFARMLKLTGESDLDRLVDSFIEKEDRNFALFNYVNRQNDTVEVCAEEIQNLKAKIESFKQQSNLLEGERKAIISKLDEDTQAAVSVADRSLERLTVVNKILEQLISRVDALFKRIGCDRSSFEGLLGGSGDVVSSTNVLQYLGLIEQRTNELLKAHSYYLARADADSGVGFDPRCCASPVLLGEGPSPPAPILPLVPPSLGDDFDSDDDDDVMAPLSRAELTSKVIKTVKKREMETMKDPYHYSNTSSSKSRAKAK